MKYKKIYNILKKGGASITLDYSGWWSAYCPNNYLAASASVDLLKDQISREIARLTTADLLSVGAAFMPLEVESPESEDYSYRYIEIGGSLTYYISPVPVLAMEAISPREQGSGVEGHIS